MEHCPLLCAMTVTRPCSPGLGRARAGAPGSLLTLPWSFFMWETYSSRSGNQEWHTLHVQPLPLDLLPALRWKRLRLVLRSSGELGGSSSSVEDDDSSEILDTGVSTGSCFGVSRTAAFFARSSLGFWGW